MQTLKEFLSFSNYKKEILISGLIREKSGGIFEGRPLKEYFKESKVKIILKIKSEKFRKIIQTFKWRKF